jgi:energy-coupling factor transporter transmembrane protein EcfT
MSADMTNRVSNDLRRLAYRVERYLRLEATERLTMVTTFVVLAAVTMALATSAIFFLSTGLVKTLNLLIGNEMLSYYIVGGSLLLIILFIFLLRKPLVENPFVRMFSKQFLEVPTITEQMMSKSSKNEQIRKLAESLVQELEDEEEEGGAR